MLVSHAESLAAVYGSPAVVDVTFSVCAAGVRPPTAAEKASDAGDTLNWFVEGCVTLMVTGIATDLVAVPNDVREIWVEYVP